MVGKAKRGPDAAGLFLVFPLASVGGAELVHLDVLKALAPHNRVNVLFWYRYNPWLPAEQKTAENYALLSEFEKYAPCRFFEDRIGERFQGLRNAFWTGYFQGLINRHKNVLLIRNGDPRAKSLFSGIRRKCKVVSIVHNAFFETLPVNEVISYLDLDFDPDVRISISEKIRELSAKVADETGRTVKGTTMVIQNAVPLPEGNYNRTDDPFCVFFAGRDASEKRFHLIYRVAQTVGRQAPEIRFVFAGPDPDRYPPLPNARFTGEIKDQKVMSGLYAQTHIFLMASSSEGFPRSMAEAMAYGAVIVSTAVGAIPEHIGDSGGRLVYDTDEEALVTSLSNHILYYHTHPDERRREGERNRERAFAHFSFERFSDAYIRTVNELRNA